LSTLAWPYYVLAGGVAFLLSLLFNGLCRRAAAHWGVLDTPGSEAHKRHAHSVPVLGGVAMAAAWFVSIAGGLGLAFAGPEPWRGLVAGLLPGLRQVLPELGIIGAGALALVMAGAWDDRHPLRAGAKFLVQAVVAAVTAGWAVRISLFQQPPLITWALTTFWLLFIINAINFLDNMDGLAGGLTVIAAFFFALVAGLRGQHFVTALAAVTSGVAGGFLMFNRPPARLFMGDAGSQFLGYCLGITGALTTYYLPGETPTPAPVLIPLLVLAVPVFDLLAVVVIRWRRGLPIYVGDNRHISHRFENLGLGRPLSVLAVLLLAVASGTAAVTLLWLPLGGVLLVLLQTAAILTLVSLLQARALERPQR